MIFLKAFLKKSLLVMYYTCRTQAKELVSRWPYESRVRKLEELLRQEREV